MVFDPQHKALTKIKNTRQTLAFLVAVKRRFTAFLPPLGQAHAATSVRTSLRCLLTARYASTLQCGQVCHTALASFSRRRYYLFANAQGRKIQGRKTRKIKYRKKIKQGRKYHWFIHCKSKVSPLHWHKPCGFPKDYGINTKPISTAPSFIPFPFGNANSVA